MRIQIDMVEEKGEFQLILSITGQDERDPCGIPPHVWRAAMSFLPTKHQVPEDFSEGIRLFLNTRFAASYVDEAVALPGGGTFYLQKDRLLGIRLRMDSYSTPGAGVKVHSYG